MTKARDDYRKRARNKENKNNKQTLSMKRTWQKILEPHHACDVFKRE
jgi:hypothetical protein